MIPIDVIIIYLVGIATGLSIASLIITKGREKKIKAWMKKYSIKEETQE